MRSSRKPSNHSNRIFQKKIEHEYSKIFEGFIRNLKEPATKEVFKKSNDYNSLLKI